MGEDDLEEDLDEDEEVTVVLAEGWQHGNPDSDISEKRLRMRPEFLKQRKIGSLLWGNTFRTYQSCLSL